MVYLRRAKENRDRGAVSRAANHRRDSPANDEDDANTQNNKKQHSFRVYIKFLRVYGRDNVDVKREVVGMGCRQSHVDNVELAPRGETPKKFTTKIDPRVLQKYDIQGKHE